MELRRCITLVLGAAVALAVLLALPSAASAHAGHHADTRQAAHQADIASLDIMPGTAAKVTPAAETFVSSAVDPKTVDPKTNDQRCLGDCCTGAACSACCHAAVPSVVLTLPVFSSATVDAVELLPVRGGEPDGLRRPPRSFA